MDKNEQAKPERKANFKTSSGIEIKNVYTPEDVKNVDYEKQTGLPGNFPFTRGIYPSMYRTKLWTMRQYAGFGTAEETNKRYKCFWPKGRQG